MIPEILYAAMYWGGKFGTVGGRKPTWESEDSLSTRVKKMADQKIGRYWYAKQLHRQLWWIHIIKMILKVIENC